MNRYSYMHIVYFVRRVLPEGRLKNRITIFINRQAKKLADENERLQHLTFTPTQT